MVFMGMEKEVKKELKRQKTMRMVDLREKFKGRSHISIYRDLKMLNYRTSYSHSGRYYTLDEVARFDSNGLCSINKIYFSRYGTLKETVYKLIEGSESGYSHEDLYSLLQVRVHNTLLDLVRENSIGRSGRDKFYIYISKDPLLAKKQLELRAASSESKVEFPSAGIVIEILAEVIRKKHICVECRDIVHRLSIKGIQVHLKQVEQVLDKYGVKKTLVMK